MSSSMLSKQAVAPWASFRRYRVVLCYARMTLWDHDEVSFAQMMAACKPIYWYFSINVKSLQRRELS